MRVIIKFQQLCSECKNIIFDGRNLSKYNKKMEKTFEKTEKLFTKASNTFYLGFLPVTEQL